MSTSQFPKILFSSLGKTSPDPDGHNTSHSSLIKQQIRHSVLNRHHRAVVATTAASSITSDHFKSLDPMSAIAELSQMQNKCFPMEETIKARHSSTENTTRGRPKPISRTRSSPLVSLSTSISPTSSSLTKKTGVAWDPIMLKHCCLCGEDSLHPESPGSEKKVDILRTKYLENILEGAQDCCLL